MSFLNRPRSSSLVWLCWIAVVPLIAIGCSGDSTDNVLPDNPVAPATAGLSDDDDDGDSRGSHPLLPPWPDVDPVVGAIGLFADSDGSSCNLLDKRPGGLGYAYVIHTGTGCKTASGFSAPIPDCMTGVTFIADTSPFPVRIGDSQAGIAVAYGAFLDGPIHVLTITYTRQGRSKRCCPWMVQNDPRLPDILYATCDDPIDEAPLPGLYAVVNPNRRCLCPPSSGHPSEWQKIRGLLGND